MDYWINVDLSGADLSGMNLSNATLSGVKSGPLVGSAPIISLSTGMIMYQELTKIGLLNQMLI